jgi:hypothetical protein
LIFFAQTMPATIFGLAMGFFPLIGLAVPSLRLTAIFSLPGQPARIAAISVSSEARSADTEYQPAPSAGNFDQQQNGCPSSLANNRKMK